MNKYLIFIFLFFVFFQENIFAKEINGKARIVDGDTVEINNNMIRLLGIDAFEIKQECFKKDNTKYKCGEQSALILATIISSQPVRCMAEKKDHYKRWLATCYIGKLDINENMVLYGYAFSYKSNKYKTTEKKAKKIRAGAWSGEFTYPWEWRKSKRK
jgi:endonuclease YncB( thermonuclease family)